MGAGYLSDARHVIATSMHAFPEPKRYKNSVLVLYNPHPIPRVKFVNGRGHVTNKVHTSDNFR